MQPGLILYPAFAVVALTFIVGTALIRLRILAVSRRQIHPGYFLLNRGGKVPDYLRKVDQNYTNLFELPMLFYLLVVVLYVTRTADELHVGLAWGFAVSRMIHTAIHVTVNRLRWRLLAFISGALMLFTSWAWLLFQLMKLDF